ncbi:DinB family protein [Mucilaginibacter antarcticus]|uniref:DinB family protein n=1 Tax=Mucilaginibacter antarcticus TaxID=1855725 RepID=A0ABW5XQ89_9SPHI
MRDYFKPLFEYNRYVNTQIAQSIISSSQPQKALDLMGHLLTAEQVWIRRLKGEHKIDIVLWPKWPATIFVELIDGNHKLWTDYLDTITDDYIKNQYINYQNFQGKEFTMRVSDVITHVINHGTHTRAQIGVHLRHNGVEGLPITDFSYYKTTITA